MAIPSLRGILDELRVQRGAVALQFIEVDASANNNLISYCDSANAKGLFINSTTDAANTAPTVGTCFVRVSVLGVQIAQFDATGLSFGFAPTHTTPAANSNNTASATTAYVDRGAAPNASYRTLLDCSASHTAARVAGTYALGQGDPAAISGTGTLYPINTIYIDAADYPTTGALAAKLRIRAQLYTNDVAPTGNYTFGLYPITRPATSGGAGLNIYTLGTVVTGSNGATFVAPAADGLLTGVGADFAIPATGHYVIGMVTTAAVAASSHVHISASLQMRNA